MTRRASELPNSQKEQNGTTGGGEPEGGMRSSLGGIGNLRPPPFKARFHGVCFRVRPRTSSRKKKKTGLVRVAVVRAPFFSKHVLVIIIPERLICVLLSCVCTGIILGTSYSRVLFFFRFLYFFRWHEKRSVILVAYISLLFSGNVSIFAVFCLVVLAWWTPNDTILQLSY